MFEHLFKSSNKIKIEQLHQKLLGIKGIVPEPNLMGTQRWITQQRRTQFKRYLYQNKPCLNTSLNHQTKLKSNNYSKSYYRSNVPYRSPFSWVKWASTQRSITLRRPDQIKRYLYQINPCFRTCSDHQSKLKSNNYIKSYYGSNVPYRRSFSWVKWVSIQRSITLRRPDQIKRYLYQNNPCFMTCSEH